MSTSVVHAEERSTPIDSHQYLYHAYFIGYIITWLVLFFRLKQFPYILYIISNRFLLMIVKIRRGCSRSEMKFSASDHGGSIGSRDSGLEKRLQQCGDGKIKRLTNVRARGQRSTLMAHRD